MSAARAIVNLIRARRLILKARPKPKLTPRMRRQQPPFGVEVSYSADILGFRATAVRLVKERLLPALPGLVGRTDAWHEDADGKRGKDLVDRIRLDSKPARARIEEAARKASSRTSDHNKQELRDTLKQGLGVDVLLSDKGVSSHLEDFVAQNVSLIESVPETMLDQVETVLLTGLRQNARAEELSRDIQERMDVSESRARLIARDQVAKLYGEVNRLRQDNLGITRYTWRTMQDERVRPTHADKEGNEYDWDDAPADTGHPGEDYQCRCYAEPILADILEAAADDDTEE